MNTQDKIFRNALTGALAALVGLSSASLASDAPFAPEAEQLAMTEVLIDAARSFEQIDVNVDGVVDVDEYVSQRIVRAQLARFKRHVEIDGQTTLLINLPETVSNRLTESERAALDTVARNDFNLRTAGTDGLTPDQWQDSRLEAFALADLDASGELEGAELIGFAEFLAGSLSMSQPGS